MRWIVDGYNVIRRDPDLAAAESRGLAAGRAALHALIAPVARRTGDPFTIVFDGEPRQSPAAAGGQVEIVFSRPPQKADDVIIALAQRHRDGAIVVTSDRRVSDAAWQAKATALPADRFVGALRTPPSDDAEDDDDDDEPDPSPRRGNPERRSARERAIDRALRRLRREA